jgi:hypothetical protein
LKPQNCRNLCYFHRVVCAYSLSNVIFFHNGNNQSLYMFCQLEEWCTLRMVRLNQ